MCELLLGGRARLAARAEWTARPVRMRCRRSSASSPIRRREGGEASWCSATPDGLTQGKGHQRRDPRAVRIGQRGAAGLRCTIRPFPGRSALRAVIPPGVPGRAGRPTAHRHGRRARADAARSVRPKAPERGIVPAPRRRRRSSSRRPKAMLTAATARRKSVSRSGKMLRGEEGKQREARAAKLHLGDGTHRTATPTTTDISRPTSASCTRGYEPWRHERSRDKHQACEPRQEGERAEAACQPSTTAAPRERKRAAAKKQPARSRKPAKSFSPRRAAAGAADHDLRVRMYRVGFGDFFLLTVPTKRGPSAHPHRLRRARRQHQAAWTSAWPILIKRDAAKARARHRHAFHADHLSGFATQYDEFAQFEVGAVWITNRLDPGDAQCDGVQVAAARCLRTICGCSCSSAAPQVTRPRRHAGAREGGERARRRLRRRRRGGNEKAMELRHERLQQQAPVHYYEAGDDAGAPAGAARRDHRRDPRAVAEGVRRRISPPATTRRNSISRRRRKGIPDTNSSCRSTTSGRRARATIRPTRFDRGNGIPARWKRRCSRAARCARRGRRSRSTAR